MFGVKTAFMEECVCVGGFEINLCVKDCVWCVCVWEKKTVRCVVHVVCIEP